VSSGGQRAEGRTTGLWPWKPVQSSTSSSSPQQCTNSICSCGAEKLGRTGDGGEGVQGPLLDGGRRGVLAEGRQDGDAGGELLRGGRTRAAEAGVAVQPAQR